MDVKRNTSSVANSLARVDRCQCDRAGEFRLILISVPIFSASAIYKSLFSFLYG